MMENSGSTKHSRLVLSNIFKFYEDHSTQQLGDVFANAEDKKKFLFKCVNKFGHLSKTYSVNRFSVKMVKVDTPVNYKSIFNEENQRMIFIIETENSGTFSVSFKVRFKLDTL